MTDRPSPRKEKLRCAECGRESDDQARGWRARHGREYPHDQPETLVFCPECAEREFGTPRYAA